MDCQSCKLPFAQAAQIIRQPLILVKCGHTLCKDCCLLVQDHKKQIKCPICKQTTIVTSVDELPINFSLLNVITPRESLENLVTTWEPDFQITLELPTSENKYSTASIRHQQSEIAGMGDKCLLHNQKLQAFCENDRELLCIDCVLKPEHKQHQMLNIDQAYTKYFSLAAQSLKISQSFDFDDIFTSIDGRREQIKAAADQTLQKIQKFSDYLIQKVNKRKTQLINIIRDRLKAELEQVKQFQQYFEDTKNQVLLTGDLIQTFQKPSDKLSFLTQIYLINDLLSLGSANDLTAKADTVQMIGSCSIIESQFKIQEELNYFIQAFKKRLRILQSQNVTSLNFCQTSSSPKCQSMSEFKLTQNVTTTSSNGSGKLQESMLRAQISKRPQSQNSAFITVEPKNLMKKDSSNNNQVQGSFTVAASAIFKQERSKQPQRSRQVYHNFKYDSEKFKLSTYSVKGQTTKMTVLESGKNHNNTIIDTQTSFNGADPLNQIAQKCLTMKKPTMNSHTIAKKSVNTLEMKRLLSSRTPKLSETQTVLSKVYNNISETKKLLERRQVRSNERLIQKEQEEYRLLSRLHSNPKNDKRSSENVSSDSKGSSEKERSQKVIYHSPDVVQTFSNGASLIVQSDDGGIQQQPFNKFTSEQKEYPKLLLESNQKSSQQSRKKWNIPKPQMKLTDDGDGENTDEFDLIKNSLDTNTTNEHPGYSSQISLRQVIYAPQKAKPGISAAAHTCM